MLGVYLGIMVLHRVEVLRPGRTDEFEFWSNAEGTVYLCREEKDDVWQAIVDGEVVIDTTNPFVNDVFTHPVKPLTAPGVSGLVPLLAMQEQIHIILDITSVAPKTAEPVNAE